ncbi:MAG: T9SS C-terminal target domain-containing protein [Candidatus Zixiibacteriota bacterium]|nr:MAG: T9SS C-terminal target domain-containing protein [candidate division Zixibacteria bacterium]
MQEGFIMQLSQKRLFWSLWISLIAAGAFTSAEGSTINVPGDYATIQAGLNAASGGDTVQVAAGTYVENLIWPTVNGIKLFGAGRDLSIIDGNNQASVLRFDTPNLIDSTTVVRGFTLTNGNALPPWPYSQGGGIHLFYASPILEYLNIVGNTADDFGGGMYIWGSSSQPVIRYVLIANNTAISHGGVDVAAGEPLFDHVTISGNSPGGFYTSSTHFATLLNSIAAHNVFYDVRVEGDYIQPATLRVGYLDSRQGISTIGFGAIVEYLGPIIEADPEFVNHTAADYHLLPESPCIDSGDPSYALDPDATVTDMGAFYYDQTVPAVNVALTPVSPPIQIGPGGGSFDFDVAISNPESAAQTFDAWIMVRLPTTAWFGPVLGPLELTLPAGGALTRQRNQAVPGGMLAGVYQYQGRLGGYPSEVWSSSGFDFTITGSGTQDAVSSDWVGTGEPFAGQALPAFLPSDLTLKAFPNPFNPSTVARYEIRDASHVVLRVYDTAGREVAGLVDGWRDAGSHEVTFDASGLPSGIYLARLEAEGMVQTQKLVLLK